ncbi:unnamed protein product [Diamesa tonsa]
MDSDDGLSKWLCRMCAEKVEEFTVFKRQCITNSNKYKQIIQGTQTFKQSPCEDVIEEEQISETLAEPDNDVFAVKEEYIGLEILNEYLEETEETDTYENEIDEEPEFSAIDFKTEEPPFKCSQCPKSYAQANNLSRHMQSVHKQLRFFCDLCDKSFSQSTTLKKHKILKHNCDVVEKSKAESIPKTEQSTKLFYCKLCPKSYTLPNNLARHMNTDHRKLRYSCNYCSKQFTQNSSLQEHQNNIHKDLMDRSASFICDHCMQSFNTIKMLQQHMRRHETTNEPKLSESKTIKSGKLKVKEDKPNISKKYHKLCPICGKMFKVLQEHILVHSGEKPNQCNICSKRFTFKTTLASHLRIHSGERPYKCDICSKAFRVSHHLREHRTTHSTERPWICNLCQKTFSSKLTLYKHTFKSKCSKVNAP